MKRFIGLTLAALMVASLSIAPPELHAGAIGAQGYGQTQPNVLVDKTTGNALNETYIRGIHWSKPVAYSATTATSVMVSVTMSAGYTSAYKGPWHIMVYNTGPTTGVFTPLSFSAAYTSDLTAIGSTLAASSAATNGVVTMKDISGNDFGHLRGQTATATGFYQLGNENN